MFFINCYLFFHIHQSSSIENKAKTDDILNFINRTVDKCLRYKTIYEQNNEFLKYKASVPNTVVKRILINKEAPIYEDILALQLDHPNILKSFKSEITTYKDESQPILWLYMEYLPINITHSYVGQNEEFIKDIAYDILKGLQYLHTKKIAHLDIKINNIMGYKDGDRFRYKIIDFGFSRVVNKEEYICKKSYGTFPYKAPEVVFDSIHGMKSDIWSLGATVLFLSMNIVDAKNFMLMKDVDLFDRYMSGSHRMVYPSYISPVVKDFIIGCMRFDRKQRPEASMLLNHKLFNEEIGFLFSNSNKNNVNETMEYSN